MYVVACVYVLSAVTLNAFADVSHYGVFTSKTCDIMNDLSMDCMPYDYMEWYGGVKYQDQFEPVPASTNAERIIRDAQAVKMQELCLRSGQCPYFTVPSIAIWPEPDPTLHQYMTILHVMPDMGPTFAPYVTRADSEKLLNMTEQMYDDIADIEEEIVQVYMDGEESKVNVGKLNAEIVGLGDAVEELRLDIEVLEVDRSGLVEERKELAGWIAYLEHAGEEFEAESESLAGLDSEISSLEDKIVELDLQVVDINRTIQQVRSQLDSEVIKSNLVETVVEEKRSEIARIEKLQDWYVWLSVRNMHVQVGEEIRKMVWNVQDIWVNPNCNEVYFTSSGQVGEIGALITFVETGCRDLDLLVPYFDLDYIQEYDVTEYTWADSPAYQRMLEWQKRAEECRVYCIYQDQ